MKRLIFDIDGTIAKEGPGHDRAYAEPIPEGVELVRRAFSEGCMVTLWTSRPWGDYRLTADWLAKHRIPFTNLVMGKPLGDLIVDDRATRDFKYVSEWLDAFKGV